MFRRTHLLLVTAIVTACRSGSSGDSPVPPLVSARQDLRVGSIDDPATTLTAVREIAVGHDGRIYSLHPQEHMVRIHDAEGRLRRTVGREGEGPGEFRSAGRMGLRGDTLWVLDYGTYRFTLFDADGDLITSRGVPVDLGDAEHNPARPRGMLSDGTIWGSPPAWSDEVASGTLTRTFNVTLDSAGRAADTLIAYSIAKTSWRLHDPSNPRGLRSFRQQPFSDAEMVVVSELRPEIVIVQRPIATDAARGEFRVIKLDLEGDTIFSRAIAYEPLPIPSGLPDSLVAEFAKVPSGLPPSMAASWPAPGRARELARASLIVPSYFPPVSQLVVGRDGAIWLQREDTGGDTREWWVFDDRGRPVARTRLPVRARLLAVDRERAWGTETDDLDVPYIVRYVLGESTEP